MWRAVWSFVHFSFDDPCLYMVFEGWDELEMMCILVYISRWLLGLVLDSVGSELSFMSAQGLLCEDGGYQDISVSPVVKEGDTPRGKTLYIYLLDGECPFLRETWLVRS